MRSVTPPATRTTTGAQLGRRDAARLRRYRQYQDFYEGRHFARPRNARSNLVLNYARAIVDKGAAYLLGRGMGFSVIPRREGHKRDAARAERAEDRKSTRLNSRHANNSYAVFCLKNTHLRAEQNREAQKHDDDDRRRNAQAPALRRSRIAHQHLFKGMEDHRDEDRAEGEEQQVPELPQEERHRGDREEDQDLPDELRVLEGVLFSPWRAPHANLLSPILDLFRA